jgi:hypothetical protein
MAAAAVVVMDSVMFVSPCGLAAGSACAGRGSGSRQLAGRSVRMSAGPGVDDVEHGVSRLGRHEAEHLLQDRVHDRVQPVLGEGLVVVLGLPDVDVAQSGLDSYGFGQRNVTFIDATSGNSGLEEIKQSIQTVKLGLNFHLLDATPWRGGSGALTSAY